jgi:hypothetical protein
MLELKAGTALLVVRHLLANRHWEVDMNTRINTSERLALLNKPQADVYLAEKAVA